jgi:hypothetical protein
MQLKKNVGKQVSDETIFWGVGWGAPHYLCQSYELNRVTRRVSEKIAQNVAKTIFRQHDYIFFREKEIKNKINFLYPAGPLQDAHSRYPSTLG